MKIVSLFISILLISLPLVGQNIQKHEVSLFTFGGLSSLNYTPHFGNTQNKFGYKLGVEYSYNFTKHWSIGTGLEFSTYNSDYKLDEYSDSYMTHDGVQNFQFTTVAKKYYEKQSIKSLNIPINGQFKMPLNRNIEIYTSVGLKIGIPLFSNYEISNVDLKNTGQYFEPENVIYDSQQFMGFGDFHINQKKQDLKLKTILLGSIEAGIRFKILKKSYLYTGLYFEHSLTNLNNNNSDNNLIEYNKDDPANFKFNGVLSSTYRVEQQNNKFVENIHVMSLGVKIRYSILF